MNTLKAVSPIKSPNFPIVGIGASAGGLEALEGFLSNVPTHSGMAFVIVQHLDPTHQGNLSKILQRNTPMPVAQIEDHTRVQPDCVYVIPPNKDLSILHGMLHLLDPVMPRGLRLPIDFFFRSLADDQQDRSIGVILSGMGSDGTLGLRAIKEKAGVVFVQEPASAKFDGMPRSAIESGLADMVAPVETLPSKISAYLRHPSVVVAHPDVEKSHSGIEKIIILLRGQTGHDFSQYKKTTIYRRIERRMGIHQIDKINSYVRFLQENPQEINLLFKELLIGVTCFFREPETWERLKTDVLPALLTHRPPSQPLRVWSPGCATGEEAYSLAILFQEVVESFQPARNYTLQIFATDLDRDAIEKAREGFYLSNIAADVLPERLARFFVHNENGYQVKKSIRDSIVFAPQNMVMDPPFTHLDLLICRNLLIYLSPELQKKLIPLFHYTLNPGGYLFLGNAETIGSFTNLFTPIDSQARLYRRLDFSQTERPVDFPAAFLSPKAEGQPQPVKPEVNLQGMAEKLILENYAPAAVLTNQQGDIVYISGRTGKYLEPAAGKANWNIFVMAREGLNHELNRAFQQALRQPEPIVLKQLRVDTNGGDQVVDVTIQSIQEAGALFGMVLIVFNDMAELSRETKVSKTRRAARTGEAGVNAQVAELHYKLDNARQEVQTIREEMQSSQEELKSANEELQSTNEELQSTNEELTTSKEEMQSINEELQTVNQELQAKLDELSHTNNDMKNLLDSVDIAILFLDNQLRVRRFTNQMTKITPLIPGDVGRPITDIASTSLYPELAEDVTEVLRTLTRVEKEITAHNERRFAVRILPYRTFENVIDGVVITFSDISTVGQH